MHGFAPFTVSALGAVHAGFDGEENAGVDGLLDLPSEVDEAVKIIVRPERIVLVVCGRFCFGEHVEPEQQHPAMEFLVRTFLLFFGLLQGNGRKGKQFHPASLVLNRGMGRVMRRHCRSHVTDDGLNDSKRDACKLSVVTKRVTAGM